MFLLRFEESTGILHVRTEGAWTMDEIARYSRELAVEVPRARRAVGELRLLIDNRRGQIASKEMSGPLGQAGQRVAAANDRIAFVLSSVLMKLQTSRLLIDALHQVFLTPEEARDWLIGPRADVGVVEAGA